jgi:phosphatidylinositol glycan class T
LLVQRYFTGYGQEFGGLAVHIFNYANCTIKATYYELIPWYLRVYFHTFNVYVNNTKHDPTECTQMNEFHGLPTLVFDVYKFIPAEERGSPTSIEFLFSLPARSSMYFTLQFEKAFLHWTEHPPDAHRGFDIGSAVVTATFEDSKCGFSLHGLDWLSSLDDKNKPVRIYTEGLLVSLPTPDFSKCSM